MLFAEREGVLFSFANKGDSLLENRSLGLSIRIPNGFRTDILESWIKNEIQSAKFDISQFTLIKTIYFDFNSSLIRNDASAELDKAIPFFAIPIGGPPKYKYDLKVTLKPSTGQN